MRQGFRGEVAEENGISAEGKSTRTVIIGVEIEVFFGFRQKVSFSHQIMSPTETAE
jgi:hypothetical protein